MLASLYQEDITLLFSEDTTVIRLILKSKVSQSDYHYGISLDIEVVPTLSWHEFADISVSWKHIALTFSFLFTSWVYFMWIFGKWNLSLVFVFVYCSSFLLYCFLPQLSEWDNSFSTGVMGIFNVWFERLLSIGLCCYPNIVYILSLLIIL